MVSHAVFLSIVIPAHNNHNELEQLLHSIQRSRFDHFEKTEIIIVDDGSKNEVKSVIGTIYRLSKNRGPAYARNFGVSKALGQYILFLDADVLLKKDTLQKAYDFFKNKKGRAFTGIWDKTQKNGRWFSQFKALRDYAYWFIEKEQNARYYLFSTRIAGIEKKLFEEIGGFNTGYKLPTVEDIELTYKIEKETKISFEPTIIVTHEFEDFLTLARKYFLRSRDWIKLYMKRLRFDPVATSRFEAYKSIIAGLFLIAVSVFFVLQLTVMAYLAFGLFAVFLAMEYRFLQFLYKEKGTIFTLYAIPTALILYLIINLGSTVGLIEYYLRKLNGLSNLPPLRISK